MTAVYLAIVVLAIVVFAGSLYGLRWRPDRRVGRRDLIAGAEQHLAAAAQSGLFAVPPPPPEDGDPS